MFHILRSHPVLLLYRTLHSSPTSSNKILGFCVMPLQDGQVCRFCFVSGLAACSRDYQRRKALSECTSFSCARKTMVKWRCNPIYLRRWAPFFSEGRSDCKTRHYFRRQFLVLGRTHERLRLFPSVYLEIPSGQLSDRLERCLKVFLSYDGNLGLHSYKSICTRGFTGTGSVEAFPRVKVYVKWEKSKTPGKHRAKCPRYAFLCKRVFLRVGLRRFARWPV